MPPFTPPLVFVEVYRERRFFPDLAFSNMIHEVPFLVGKAFKIEDPIMAVAVKTFNFDVKFDNALPLLIFIRVFPPITSVNDLRDLKKEIKKLTPVRIRKNVQVKLLAG